MNASTLAPRRLLAQMLVGNQIQQAIYVAAKLGVADELKSGPKRADEMASKLGVHVDALYRLLRALTGFGVFSQDEEGRFALTPLGSLLESGTPSRAFALWTGGVSYQAFGGLEYSVCTGAPAFQQIFGTDFFDYLDRHPEVGDLFDELMSWHTGPVAPAIAALDFSGIGTLVDIGGGRGELLAVVLKAHPKLMGVLVDRPRAISSARRVIEAACVSDRCQLICGDILSGLPAGDAYMLKSVVHGLSDKQAIDLLTNCEKAMNKGGKVLLVEFIMPPGNEPFPGRLMDLLMLVGGAGRERTKSEFNDLLMRAGFQLLSVQPTSYAYSVLEACPMNGSRSVSPRDRIA